MLCKLAEKSFEGLALFFFTSAAFCCALYYTVGTSFELDEHALWTLWLIFAAWVLAALGLEADSAAGPSGSIRIPLLFFLVGLALGLYRLGYFSVWIDEEIQARAVHGPESIVSAAALTQMPLSYFFTALGISWLGMDEWGLRIFPCLFAAGSAALFSRSLIYLVKNEAVKILGSLLFVANPWVIRYSQEGRPYSLALFCTVLWVLSALRLFDGRGKAHFFSRVYFLLAATILLGLSIAFQALLLILSFAALMAAVFGFWPRLRGLAAVMFVTQAGVALALLPLVHLAMERSRKFLHAVPEIGALAISPLEIKSKFQSMVLFGPGVYLIFPAAAFFFWMAKRKTTRAHGETATLVFCLYALLVIFVFSFWGAFSLLVRYDLFLRYYVVAIPLAMLPLMGCVATLVENAERAAIRWGICGFFFFAAVAPEIQAVPDVYRGARFDHWNVDYRSLFRILRENGRAGDVAYVLPYRDPSAWEQVGFHGKKFYFKFSDPVSLADQLESRNVESAADLILADLDVKKPSSIFLAFIPDLSADELSRARSGITPKDEVFSGEAYSLIRLDATPDASSALDRFLAGLASRAQPRKNAFRIYDVLLRLAERRKDPGACAHWLKELGAANDGSPKILQILQTHSSRCPAGESRKGWKFRSTSS